MQLPKSLQNLVDAFERLPGIGPKTAQRLAFYVLRMPKEYVISFSQSLSGVVENVSFCERCFNVSDDSICEICKDNTRDDSLICVVESALDVLAIEKAGFKGLYHVLNGVVNPLAGIGPDELYIAQLIDRLSDNSHIKEVILALGTSLEGETTSTYIKREIEKLIDLGKIKDIRLTRLGRGLPVGADIEYADGKTLNDAFSARIDFN